jgi:cytidylate kinase
MKITKQRLAKIIKEELSLVNEGGDLQNTAKAAAMELLDTAKIMEQAPSHDPASRYAQEVAKQANLIMDMLVQMEDDEAARHQRQSPSGDNYR